MKRTMMLMALVAIALGIAAVRAQPPSALASDCRKTSVGLTPLTDLGAKNYQGFPGGLYGTGENEPPAARAALAAARAALIQPLGPNGTPATDGKIVLLSIGMSNTTMEFAQFVDMAKTDPQVNPKVLLVDGAQGGQTAAIIKDPSAQFWTIVDDRLTTAGASRSQVQAIWLKEAESRPTGPFPESAQSLSSNLQAIVGILADRFPNLKIAYLSSRIYAGYAITALNPEPFAYESGFAVKWLIDKQIAGDASLNADPAKGPVRAPVLLWGPYLWADGLTPRSDGLIWRCEDFADDGTHPGPSGRQKVANMLTTFFKTDDTTRPWFMADPNATPLPVPTIYQPPTLTPRPTSIERPTPNPTGVTAPRSYRVKETPSGDQMWITTSNRMVQRQMERLAAGEQAWLCGRVEVNPDAEWGFQFAPDQLALTQFPPPQANRTTIRALAADPAAAGGAVRCIRIEAVTEWVEGTPPATGTPGTPMPTTVGPGPTSTRPSPFPTRPGRTPRTPGPGPGTGTPPWFATPVPTATSEPTLVDYIPVLLPMLFRNW